MSGSAIAFLKGKMGSADGKRERERENIHLSQSQREGRFAWRGGSDARKTQLNLNAAEKSRRQGKKMASSAVPCVSTSNCEMARKQESPKEINRPRPDYLWLVVGIKSLESGKASVCTDCVMDGLDVEFERADDLPLLEVAQVLVALVHHLHAGSITFTFIPIGES